MGMVLGLLQLWLSCWIVNHNFSGMPRVPTRSLRILSYGECPNLGKSLIGSEGNFTSDSSPLLDADHSNRNHNSSRRENDARYRTTQGLGPASQEFAEGEFREGRWSSLVIALDEL